MIRPRSERWMMRLNPHLTDTNRFQGYHATIACTSDRQVDSLICTNIKPEPTTQNRCTKCIWRTTLRRSSPSRRSSSSRTMRSTSNLKQQISDLKPQTSNLKPSTSTPTPKAPNPTPTPHAKTQDLRESVFNEIALLVALSGQPSIITVFDYEIADHYVYMV